MTSEPVPVSPDAPDLPLSASLADLWHDPPPPGTDPVVWASQYFRQVRQVAIEPSWIAIANPDDQHLAVQTWIGGHIHSVNQSLQTILNTLLASLQPADRPAVSIFAAPIAPKVGVDGFCNLKTQPITLVVDPSRVVVADWPHLVAHELAHAIAQAAGHGPRFHQALAHLCLAEGLPQPPADSLHSGVLPYWPPCRSQPQPLNFWLGQGDFSAA